MPYREERNAAVRAAELAAAAIRSFLGQISSYDVAEKGTHDLVTVADKKAQEIILRVLGDAFPMYSALAEEESDTVSTGSDSEYQWIIDPIDGTTNFLHGLPPFAVSIGLRRGKQLVTGVVLEVARHELFTATLGGGCYLNGAPVRVSTESILDNSLLTTGFPYREFAYLDDYLSVLGKFMNRSRGVRRPGASSVDLAYLAAGRLDGFFELGLSPWDVAAGSLLVTEAGGRVTDFFGMDHFLFGGQMLASNGHIHDQMFELLRPLQRYAS